MPPSPPTGPVPCPRGHRLRRPGSAAGRGRRPMVARRVVHLPLRLDGASAEIGPLVVPGSAVASAVTSVFEPGREHASTQRRALLTHPPSTWPQPWRASPCGAPSSGTTTLPVSPVRVVEAVPRSDIGTGPVTPSVAAARWRLTTSGTWCRPPEGRRRRTRDTRSGRAWTMGTCPTFSQRALTRSVRLASLPLGHAGRVAVGLGKRVGGAPAEAVAAEVQARTAAQLFQRARPTQGRSDEVRSKPSRSWRPPFPRNSVLPIGRRSPNCRMLRRPCQRPRSRDPGRGTRAALADRQVPRSSTMCQPPRRRSGGVHRAVWRDGREVAVKVQYPEPVQPC